MDGSSLLTYILAGIPVGLLLYSLFSPQSLRSIPTVGGPSAPVLSYLGALQYVHRAKEIFDEGYTKYKGSVFKVAMLDRWLVVVTGKSLVDELQRLPDNTVSLVKGAGELSSTRYIFGTKLEENPYHLNVIRQQLTRSLVHVFEDMYDEITVAFEDYIPATTTEWSPISAMVAIRNIVARASGRVFVGYPLCRISEYMNLGIDFTLDVGKARTFVSFFPPFLKPFAAKFVADMNPRVQSGLKILGPTISERWKALDSYGDEWSDKPYDVLQWLIEEARAHGDGPDHVVRMLLMLNFAAIFTSSHSFTHAFYHLAASPELLKVLREEIDPIIQEHGWSKASVGKMHKLDSFMRESQRVNGINTTAVIRETLKDVTFSNGVTIPAGNIIVTPTVSTHADEENYVNAHVFDPFRHIDLRADAKGTEGLKHHFVSTANDYVAFGLGKHACPGRFFAANELKTMMAHLIINYDVKLDPEGVRPPNIYYGFSVIPNPTATVLFKKRSVTKND